MTELEKRAKFHRKKQKGMSPFVKLNAGDPEINAQAFNHSMGSDVGADVGCGESLEKENKMINIKEELNKLDLANENKYDLLNIYECAELTNEDKKEIAKLIKNKSSDKVIYDKLCEMLNESSNYGYIDYYSVDGNKYPNLKDALDCNGISVVIRDGTFWYESFDEELLEENSVDIDELLDEVKEYAKNVLGSKEIEFNESYYQATKDTKVKDWYKKSFPSDSLGDEIPSKLTFGKIFDSITNDGEVGVDWFVNDSIVRERIFNEMSKVFNVDYDFIYDKWLDSEEVDDINEDYRQGDERIFTPDDEEYDLFKELANKLNELSPNKHNYVVEQIYLDYGSKWMWTTIVDKTVDVQVLNPAQWLALVNKTFTVEEIAKDVLTGKYCQDKGFVDKKDIDESVRVNGYYKNDNNMIYRMSVRYGEASDGTPYAEVRMALICGWEYLDNGMGWMDAEGFVDDVQSDYMLVYLDDDSIGDVLKDNGYEETEKPERIYRYDEQEDRYVRVKEGFCDCEFDKNTINEASEEQTSLTLISALNNIKRTLKDFANSNEVYDIDISTEDGYSIYLFWHTPSLNVSLFPILQIDTEEKTIFNREGSENKEYWYKLADEAINKLSKNEALKEEEYLSWDDLTDEEKQVAIERYISIRETEEGRSSDEINNDYPNYINADFVRECKFIRTVGGIDVII